MYFRNVIFPFINGDCECHRQYQGTTHIGLHLLQHEGSQQVITQTRSRSLWLLLPMLVVSLLSTKSVSGLPFKLLSPSPGVFRLHPYDITDDAVPTFAVMAQDN